MAPEVPYGTRNIWKNIMTAEHTCVNHNLDAYEGQCDCQPSSSTYSIPMAAVAAISALTGMVSIDLLSMPSVVHHPHCALIFREEHIA
jgi:hypothetical protein